MSLTVCARRLHARLTPANSGDRGAVAVVVALLLGSGVLLGMGALVVDIGSIYVEREQLQSGADASAIKIAQVCATGPAGCAPAAGLAGRYADANARDGSSGASVMCGRGGGLAACPEGTGGVTDCVRGAPAAGNYIEVHTSTRLPDGSTVLPSSFAQAVVNGYRGPTVKACARVRWGSPSSARSGLLISACEWDRYTGNGTSFPDPPAEQVIYLRGDSRAGVCPPPAPPGADVPGGFGWLDDPAPDCRTPVGVNGAYRGDPGTDPPAACQAALASSRATGRPTLMPMWGAVTADGGRITYTVLGFAAFVVTGWDLPGSQAPSTLTGDSPCASAGTCVYGYFTRAVLPGGGSTGGPDLGAQIVGLIG